MNRSPEEIQAIIDRIGVLLAVGFNMLPNYYADYESQKSAAGATFSEQTYFEQQQKPLADWSNEVFQYIQETFGGSHHYLFHIARPKLTSLHRVGIPINASNQFASTDAKLTALEEIAFRLEEKLDLSIRQEIAKQQADASTLYEITFKSRQIMLNGILVANPHFESENEVFFDYVFNRPFERIKIADLERDTKHTITKPISNILADLRFTGSLKAIFFPNASSKAVEFRNPITKAFHADNNLPVLDLNYLRSSKK